MVLSTCVKDGRSNCLIRKSNALFSSASDVMAFLSVYPNNKRSKASIHFGDTSSSKEAVDNGRDLPERQGIETMFSKPAVKRQLKRINSISMDSLCKNVCHLHSLNGLLATSTADRLNILDRRDKIIRKSMGSTNSENTFDAACPDMCPERERYARQEQHRLSIFECCIGSCGKASRVDHSRAVKEYSRSSAGQEAPLPHELRPLPVLSRTMQYLLTEIADACVHDGGHRGQKIGWGEWYDFLWNRTRAIRKEITQQRLCNVATAVIVEQTARFHIFAAARLCELPVDEFDPKMNDENLTKCLQTLKELYSDLSAKGDESSLASPNESEFRCYMILRNLNDPTILNDVSQFSPVVRSSANVKLAMEAYFALSNNNYARFFKVVHRADFLQACLLHRYFNQVRSRALRVILRSYSPFRQATSVMPLPLKVLVNQLAFENKKEAVEFCEMHGLKHSDEMVFLSRASFSQPTEEMRCRRARDLIESKLGARRIGDVLYGGMLPRPFDFITPESSFDENNKYVGSCLDADRKRRRLSEDQSICDDESEIKAEDKEQLSDDNVLHFEINDQQGDDSKESESEKSEITDDDSMQATKSREEDKHRKAEECLSETTHDHTQSPIIGLNVQDIVGDLSEDVLNDAIQRMAKICLADAERVMTTASDADHVVKEAIQKKMHIQSAASTISDCLLSKRLFKLNPSSAIKRLSKR